MESDAARRCPPPLVFDDKDKAIEQAQFILGEFAEKFTAAYQAGRQEDRPVHRTRRRRGAGAGPARRLAQNLYDFTLTFRHLSDAAGEQAATVAGAISSPIPRAMKNGRTPAPAPH